MQILLIHLYILIVTFHIQLCLLERDKKQLFNQFQCILPKLKLTPTETSYPTSSTKQLVCTSLQESDWVYVNISKMYLNNVWKSRNAYCSFKDILLDGDFKYKYGKPVFTRDSYQSKASDVVKVNCELKTGKSWNTVLNGIHYNATLRQRAKSQNGLFKNVLLLGVASTSSCTFANQLPITYKYLTSQLNAQIFNGYSTMGDTTLDAFIPMLIGKSKRDLFKMDDTQIDYYLNNIIWKQYSNESYVTGYVENIPSNGAFSNDFKGFSKIKTDHFLHPFYLAYEDLYNSGYKLCYGHEKYHNIVFNYIENFLKAYKKQSTFLYAFHSAIFQKRYNLINIADRDMYTWLKHLNRTNILRNTLLIIFSDHGFNYNHLDLTTTKKLDERQPFLSIILPNWFKRKYPQAYHNLNTNTERLTTPLDIFKTLQHVIKWKTFDRSDSNGQSMSLFHPIPKERDCIDATIPPSRCICLESKSINKSNFVKTVAQLIIKTINELTQQLRHICNELKLFDVVSFVKLQPNEYVLNQTKLTTTLDMQTFLVQLKTTSNHIYSTIVYKFHNKTIDIDQNNIELIVNGNENKCNLIGNVSLEQFCNCKN